MEISVNQNNKTQKDVETVTLVEEPQKKQQKEETLLDFSSMFKKNGFAKRPMPKLGAQRKVQTQAPNWLLEIPAKLQITTSDFQQRRFMTLQKWMSMTRTSSVQDCPIAGVLSSINFFLKENFSQSFTQIKLKETKEKLQISDNFTKQLLRRQVIQQCIKLITHEKKLNLDIKVHELSDQGKNREFVRHVIQSLNNKKKTFIYICYNHVFCPIGFDNTPLVPLDAYKKPNEINPQKMELWFILASVLKTQAPFVIKRWTDIEKEMTSRWPQYLDLEEAKKGVQTWNANQQNSQPKAQQVSCWIQLTLNQTNS